MATSFPGGLDSFTNPTGSDGLATEIGTRTHSEMHADINDAMEAVQTALGANLSAVILDTLLTTTGDIIYASGANTPARLAKGTAAYQTLRMNSGATLPEWGNPYEAFIIACSDETTALTTGTAKATFRMPYAFTVGDVRASVTTAPTGGTLLTVDVNESGTTILSTKLTFDASEKTTTTAATARVISDSSLADDAEITIDIDAVGSTIAGAGLKVAIIGYRT